MKLLPVGIFGRLVLGLAAVSVSAICATALFLYSRIEVADSQFYEGTLQSFAENVAKGVTVTDGTVTATVARAIARRIAEEKGRFIVTNSAGERLAGTAGVEQPFIPIGDVAERYFQLPEDGSPKGLYGISFRVPDVSPATYVQVAFPSGHVVFESVLDEFVQDIAWLWIPFMLLMLATNLVVVRIALRPLVRAVAEVEAIQPGGVSVLLSEKGLPDDLLALVRAVNQAIGRLREGYRAQQEFVGDMAHELRTPLAVLKAQLAVADAPYARLLERDLAGMERLIEQLLDRARLGRSRIEPGDVVDLRNVARETSAFLAPRIVDRGRSIEVIAGDDPVLVAGQRDDLFRALRNLIENALEHSPVNGMISVEVTSPPAIVVRDRGDGFANDVLDEDHRRGQVRSDRRDGVGLGLSIVERTMIVHGGKLRLANHHAGGACAEMRFPAHATAA
jgi:signal transduction histidine kinase